jgi:hypothetical protein
MSILSPRVPGACGRGRVGPTHEVAPRSITDLAESLGGAIDLGGRLYGQVPAEVASGFGEDVQQRWTRQADYIARVVATLPGLHVEIDDRQFCDAVFLRAWIAHPYVRMVK